MSNDCDRCGMIVEECDNCEMLNVENDSLHAEIAEYKAKEFINLVEALGNIRASCRLKPVIETKREEELREKCLNAYETCIAAYMLTLNQMTFNIITMEAGVTFAQNVSETYRKVFKRDYFKIEEGE